MNLKLVRQEYLSTGIFGQIISEFGQFTCFTLEHSYPNSDGTCSPKIPVGTYICVRGIHQLQDAVPFETFEISDVPGHTGCLIHPGNFDKDSSGCVLVGQAHINQMITNSRETFAQLMDLQAGVNSFQLDIIG